MGGIKQQHGDNLYNYTSKTLRNGYVFYPDIGDYHKELEKNLYFNLNWQKLKLQDASRIVNPLIQMAQKEREKEIRFLKTIFKKADLTQAGDMIASLFSTSAQTGSGQLIRTINEALNIKEVFERNLALIRESNGQKAIFTWFGGYFEQEANKFFDNSSPETFINLGANANSSLEEMIEQTSDKWLDIITQKALKYMMQQAKVESGIKTNRDKYKDAYKDLTSRIGNFSTPGSLAADMNKIYGITDMTKEIVTEITSNINKNNKKLKLSSILVGKNKANGTAGWGAHKKGSFAMESWINNIVISKLNNLNAHSFRADGSHGSARADLVSMFDVNIDLSLAEKWIREEVTNYREKNIALNNDFINKLSMLSDDGYIVYTSAKNYVLDNKHDMAAGEAMTISSFLNTISRVQANVDTLAGIILQFTKGAIKDGDTTMKNNLTTVLAQYIAYFLFDDFEAIGVNKVNGVNAIHLMNINGVFYPLSELLFVLAKAMLTATKKSDINKIVRITLKPSTVIYKKKEGVPMGWKEAYLPDTPSQAWEKQREHAMNNFKIAAHFLKNFADIMRTMNI